VKPARQGPLFLLKVPAPQRCSGFLSVELSMCTWNIGSVADRPHLTKVSLGGSTI
jgi:hypothetical protein